MIFSAIAAAIGIGSTIFNIGNQLGAAAAQREQAEKQRAYYDRVADDVRRKGDVQISQLRIAGAKEIGELEFAASRSGVAMAGTALDLKELSEENIQKDIEQTELDIEAMIDAAEMTGEQAYIGMMNQARTQTLGAVGSTLGLTQNLLNKTQSYTDNADTSGDTGFLAWLSS